MNIYANNTIQKLKHFKLRQGNWYLCRLIGISLEENNNQIEVFPVYRSIGIERHPGQIVFVLPWFKKDILISFSGRGIETMLVDANDLIKSEN